MDTIINLAGSSPTRNDSASAPSRCTSPSGLLARFWPSRSVFLHEEAMVVVGCAVPGCAFETRDVSEALAIALLTNHGLVHRNPPAQIPTLHDPKLDRPKVDDGVTIEEWNMCSSVAGMSFTPAQASELPTPLSSYFSALGLNLETAC